MRGASQNIKYYLNGASTAQHLEYTSLGLWK